MKYTLMEVSLASRDVRAQEEFWKKMFDAKVLFRGMMASQPFTRLLACGITIIFREDPDLVLPPGPGQETQFRQHLGLRVDDFEEAIAELEARGAKFVMTPALVRQYQQAKQTSGRPFLETEYIAPPLTRERGGRAAQEGSRQLARSVPRRLPQSLHGQDRRLSAQRARGRRLRPRSPARRANSPRHEIESL